MKKLSVLLAVVLSLVMLALPMGASAETIDMLALQISNPTVTVGDQTVSLDGLTLQLSGGANDDQSLVQVFLDLISNGSALGSAVVQYDQQTGIAGYVGGMTKAYGLNMQEIQTLLAQLQSQLTANMPSLDMNALNSLSADLEAAFEALAGSITLGDPEARGDMTYQTINGDLTDSVKNLVKTVFTNPAITSLMDYTGGSLDMDVLDQLEKIELTGEYGANADGSHIAADIDCLLTVEGETGTIRLHADLNGDTVDAKFSLIEPDGEEDGVVVIAGTASETQIALTATVADSTEEIVTEPDEIITLNYLANGTAYQGTLEAVEGDYGETTRILFSGDNTSIKVNFNDEASIAAGYTDDGDTFTGYLNVTDEYDEAASITVNFQRSTMSGSLSIVADGQTLVLSLTSKDTAAEGALYSGMLTLAVDDGYEPVTMSVQADVVSGQIDSDQFYINPANIVSLLNLSDAEGETALTELEGVVRNVTTALESSYPMLEGLTESIFGY